MEPIYSAKFPSLVIEVTGLLLGMFISLGAAIGLHRVRQSGVFIDATRRQHHQIYRLLVRRPVTEERYLTRARIVFEGSALLFGLIALLCLVTLIVRLT